MSRHVRNLFTRYFLGASVGLSAALLASTGWSQAEPAPPAPPAEAAPKAEVPPVDAPKAEAPPAEAPQPDAPADAAKDAAKDLKDDAPGAVRDAARDVPPAARDAARDLRDDARDAVRETREGARDAVRDTREGVRDTVRDTRDTVRDVRGSLDARAGVSARTGVGARTSLQWQDMRSADLGLWFDRNTRDGLLISDVDTRGPIARLGFREGDRIVSVAGRPVRRQDDFMRSVFTSNVRGGRVPVIVLRGGQEQTIYMEPQTFITHINAPQTDPLEQLGLILDDRIQDKVVVWKVMPRSPAHYAGIRSSDAIISFNGQPVATPDELSDLAAKAEPGPIAVEVQRGERARQLEVDFRTDVQARTALRPGYDSGPPIIEGADLAVPAVTVPARGYYNDNLYRAPVRRGLFRWRR